MAKNQGIDAALIDAPLAVDAETPLSELLSHVGQAPCAVPVVGEETTVRRHHLKTDAAAGFRSRGGKQWLINLTRGAPQTPLTTRHNPLMRGVPPRLRQHLALTARHNPLTRGVSSPAAPAPTDGGTADWLTSAPAPEPEHFNIMDPFHKTLIPLDRWVTEGIDWVVTHFRPVFQGIRVPVDYILNGFQQLMLGMPAPVAIVLFSLIAWQFGSAGMGVATLISLILIGAIGAWSQAMITLALVLTALLFCVVIGLPMGIWLARSPRAAKNYPAAAGCDADYPGVCLSGADCDAVWHRQRAGRGGDHYLRPAAYCASDHSGD
ncbi:Glycine betaine/L-proline transport system permease protein proW [Leclercia adecarboxylata]|uniref:Glycine betaine/L-proline transport system permease protein proW n=1 Tax=Leclercia adecarboxylata TaxID=83655 RepID=A0A4U9IEM8_9ENTR|nr:Glycine betaine/L-proline transport system permease protein proW [Leclercia adecarboxylata]